MVTLTESDPSEFVLCSMTMPGFDDEDVDAGIGMAMAIGTAIGSLCSLFGKSVDHDGGGALGY